MELCYLSPVFHTRTVIFRAIRTLQMSNIPPAFSEYQPVRDRVELLRRLQNNLLRGWTVNEVVEVFGISRATLYRIIKAGEIKVYKRGGSTRIAHAELVRWNQGRDPLTELASHLKVLSRLDGDVPRHFETG